MTEDTELPVEEPTTQEQLDAADEEDVPVQEEDLHDEE